MFEKFSRSWALVKASAGVLRADSELLVFPLVSSVAAALVAATFIAPALLFTGMDPRSMGRDEIDIGMMVWAFLFYLSQYFVIFFFNSALIGAAMIRLDGGDPTLSDGLRIAWSKVGKIFGYAVIAATVGMLLRMLEQRAGWLGKLVSGLLGVAWTFASFLVVPILVSRDIGPLDAVKESASLLRRTWGENLIGSGGIGVVGGLVMLLLVFVGGGLAVLAFIAGAISVGVAIVVLTLIAMVVSGLIQAALAGIYSAALYRFAHDGRESVGFDNRLLQAAFAPKH